MFHMPMSHWLGCWLFAWGMKIYFPLAKHHILYVDHIKNQCFQQSNIVHLYYLPTLIKSHTDSLVRVCL